MFLRFFLFIFIFLLANDRNMPVGTNFRRNTKKENQTDGIKSDKKTSDFLSQSQNGAIVLPKSNEESEFFRDVLEEAKNLNSDMSEQNTKDEKSFLDESNVENLKKDNYFIEP